MVDHVAVALEQGRRREDRIAKAIAVVVALGIVVPLAALALGLLYGEQWARWCALAFVCVQIAFSIRGAVLGLRDA